MSFGGTQGQNTKKVGEDGRVTFDFTSSLTLAETISSQVVTASVYSGVDPTPALIISGAATASGKIVTQLVVDGVQGCIYQLLCSITTSLGQRLEISSYLAVVPALG